MPVCELTVPMWAGSSAEPSVAPDVAVLVKAGALVRIVAFG